MLDLDDQTDHRQWTQQHLDAADLRNPSMAPTPPQGEMENDCMDVNVRGPGMKDSHLHLHLYLALNTTALLRPLSSFLNLLVRSFIKIP